MNSGPTRHLADRILIAFNSGKLNGSNAAKVDEHLKRCQRCRQRLAKLPTAHAQVGPKQARVGTSAALPAGSRPVMRVTSARQGAGSPVASRSNVPTPATCREALTAAVGAAPKPGPPPLPVGSHGWIFIAAGATVLGVVFAGVLAAWAVGAFVKKTAVAATSAKNPEIVSGTDPATKEESKPRVTTNPEKPTTRPAAANLPGNSGPKSSADTPGKKGVEKLQIALNKGMDHAVWDATPGIWHFEDGSIVGSLKTGQNGPAILVSQNKYKDFDLKFKAVLPDDSAGSAVAFRSHLVDIHSGQIDGPECAISGKNAPTDRRAGSLIGLTGNNEQPADAKRAVSD